MTDSTLYNEGCNFIRHYSNASLTVRIATLVQGIVLLSIWAYSLFQMPQPIYVVAIYVPLFGIMLTTLLYMMHRGYLIAADEYTASVLKLESNFSGISNGPVGVYESRRNNIYNNDLFTLATVHSTFTLLWIAFIVCFIYSILEVN